MYGFIYITTNLVNGKKYLGQRKYSKGWESYLGSGVAFKKALKKYGKENFKREIIVEAETAEELNQFEKELSIKYDVVNSDNWYNLCYGGGATTGYVFSEESKRKMSEKAKGRYSGEKNPMYGVHRKHTEEERQHLHNLFSGEKNAMYGRCGKNAPSARAVYIAELEKYFDTIKECAAFIGVAPSNVSAVLSGKRKTVHGYHILYAEQVNSVVNKEIA